MLIGQHKKIHRFQISGSISDDSYLPRMRRQYESMLHDIMSGKGYLRVFDLDTSFSTVYNDDRYDFTMSMYGIYVGKRIARCHEGIFGNRLIRKPETTTADLKLDQSSQQSG